MVGEKRGKRGENDKEMSEWGKRTREF